MTFTLRLIEKENPNVLRWIIMDYRPLIGKVPDSITY